MEADQLNLIQNASQTSPPAPPSCGGIFDYDAKKSRLVEVAQDPRRSRHLVRRASARRTSARSAHARGDRRQRGEIESGLATRRALRARQAKATTTRCARWRDVTRHREARRRPRIPPHVLDPMDPNNCFVDINAGQGGTEAQDWAQMLLRMYLKYCDRKGSRRSCSKRAPAKSRAEERLDQGDRPYAYGHFRTENGIHRLVRKSPFDSNARRHTSFASVFVYPRSTRPSRSRSTRRTCASTPTALRRGRPAREQDRLRGAHHAPADQHRRFFAERPSQHRKPRRSVRDAEVEALRSWRCARSTSRSRSSRTQDRYRLGAPDPLVTVLDSRASRTCAPNVEVGTHAGVC
jgi:hypothetical protein